tara:strand:+ start:346 stop:738 length:393 start_codon:yes stop_codon:yes gene_type:complete
VRPILANPNVLVLLAGLRTKDIDLVIMREFTEGLFRGSENHEIIGDAEARDTQINTRTTSERLFRFTFEITRARKERSKRGRDTCIDKANMLASMAFFRKIFNEIAPEFPDCAADHHYIDATALDLVRRP